MARLHSRRRALYCSLLLLALTCLILSCRKSTLQNEASAEASAKTSISSVPKSPDGEKCANSVLDASSKTGPDTTQKSVSILELENTIKLFLRKGVFTSSDIDNLRTALERIAELSGADVKTVSAQLLHNMGDSAQAASFSLQKALAKQPDVFVQAVQEGLDGKARKMALLAFYSTLSQQGDTEGLAKAYEILDVGMNRSNAATAYATTELTKEGLNSCLQLIRQFEYPEERRMALDQVMTDLSEDGGSANDEAAMALLFELAKREGLELRYNGIFSAKDKKDAIPP